MVYGGEKELKVVTGYCDAAWHADRDDSWVFLLNRGTVTWKSSKQDTLADSTCESENIAACEASKEAIWMKNFIGDLAVVPTLQDLIEMFEASLAVALDGTLCLVDQDRLRPIIVDDLSKWETVGFSV
ncbi:hypothetical protein Tco_0877864 [Tanacetum coccineum]|uniref:Uncharacterized protein n=1 Tax=Tanacetum coccineum TaxID=301880 RepID=A0ABQ5BZQ5_9ASTR